MATSVNLTFGCLMRQLPLGFQEFRNLRRADPARWGSPLSFDRTERKLAAILAADMVGFSRQIGIDEDATLRRLASAREQVIDPTIGSHHGRIFKLVGDGILAEFPSAVLALRCAVAIQTELHERTETFRGSEPLRFRIAVHQGEVVIDRDDLLGDGVNVAVRLEKLADHGGICVSGRVQEDASGKITMTFEDLGERRLRNIARPIRALRVRMPWMEPLDAEAERTFVRFATQLSGHRLLISFVDEAPRNVEIGPDGLTIGRALPCGLILRDREVSRQHCRIELCAGHAWLTDLGSSNGTFIDGQRITMSVSLTHGTTIVIGSHRLVYECNMPSGTTETAALLDTDTSS